jgi:hypothetical protein
MTSFPDVIWRGVKAEIRLQFAAEGQILDVIFCLSHRDAKRYNYLLSYLKGILEVGDP